MIADNDNVVDLPGEFQPPSEPPPTPPTRAHGIAIAGMAVCALVGIVSMLAYITVNWPGDTARYIAGTFVLAGIGFLACASAAVLTAARDTYGRTRGDE